MTKADIKLPPIPVGFPLRATQATRDYARAAAEPYATALRDLIRDLEMRSNMKTGRSKGLVDCGNGVYQQAKRALGELP